MGVGFDRLPDRIWAVVGVMRELFARLRRRKAEEAPGLTPEHVAELQRRIHELFMQVAELEQVIGSREAVIVRLAETERYLGRQLAEKARANAQLTGQLEGALRKYAITAAQGDAYRDRAVTAEADVKELRGQLEDQAAKP